MKTDCFVHVACSRMYSRRHSHERCVAFRASSLITLVSTPQISLRMYVSCVIFVCYTIIGCVVYEM